MFDTQPAANGTPNATNTPARKRPGRSAAKNDSGTGKYADDAEPVRADGVVATCTGVPTPVDVDMLVASLFK